MKCSHLMLLSYLINITDILSIQHLGSFLRTAVVHIFWHTSTSSILSDVNNQISTIFTFDNNIGLVNLRPHTYTKRYFNLQVIGNNNKVNRCQALRWALLIQTPQFPIFSCEIINFFNLPPGQGRVRQRHKWWTGTGENDAYLTADNNRK